MYAAKGEGIYKQFGTGWARGRGHILNGGGGGNGNNGGGGGGANFTAGGLGGPGYTCSGNPSGGIGGAALGTYADGMRVFMGGGGGGGEGNSNSSSVGARGGGIILIKANSIVTSSGCSGGARAISANGGNANASGTDGAGGGGAGGSIVMHVGTYDINASCPLTFSANGGNGGNVNDAADHGGGGGGGQGAALFLGMVPLNNITVTTNNGIGGCNSSACLTRAGNGGGSNNWGVLAYGLSPLPIQLLSFEAVHQEPVVDLYWSLATQKSGDVHLVERSTDGMSWETIHENAVAADRAEPTAYSTRDPLPLPGVSYYRLTGSGHDGSSMHSHVVMVQRPITNGEAPLFYPNPASDHITLLLDPSAGTTDLTILNELGQIQRGSIQLNDAVGQVNVSDLATGVYIAVLTNAGGRSVHRLVIER